MANVSRERGRKSWKLSWYHDGEKKAIRIGEMSEVTAKSFLKMFEQLKVEQETCVTLSPEVKFWLASLPEATRKKLIKSGIVDRRKAVNRIQQKPNLLCTYFMQCGGKYGPIKIGKAIDPEERVAVLQTGNPEPISLIGTLVGDKERELHFAYADWRINGEWFELTRSLISFIRENSDLFDNSWHAP